MHSEILSDNCFNTPVECINKLCSRINQKAQTEYCKECETNLNVAGFFQNFAIEVLTFADFQAKKFHDALRLYLPL